MAAPTLTPEQRAAALEKAAEARKKRAELKEALKTGKTTVKDVLASNDEVIKKTKVSAVIGALPGYGKARVAKVMEECGIADNRRIGGLGDRQKEELLAAIQ